MEFNKNQAYNNNLRVYKNFGDRGRLLPAEWFKILKQHNFRCAKCGESTNLTIDHIIPLSRGGSNTAKNVQPLCLECNQAKGATSENISHEKVYRRRRRL